MHGDSFLMKVISLENYFKVKKENHLLFVEDASDLAFPLLLNPSLQITASHSLLQKGTEKGILTTRANCKAGKQCNIYA